jgi:hypothetical protein
MDKKGGMGAEGDGGGRGSIVREEGGGRKAARRSRMTMSWWIQRRQNLDRASILNLFRFAKVNLFFCSYKMSLRCASCSTPQVVPSQQSIDGRHVTILHHHARANMKPMSCIGLKIKVECQNCYLFR